MKACVGEGNDSSLTDLGGFVRPVIAVLLPITLPAQRDTPRNTHRALELGFRAHPGVFCNQRDTM